MKKNDLALIIGIVVVAGTFSIIFSSLVINPKRTDQKVPVVDPISAEFPNVQEDEDLKIIFGPKAINPSLQIKIGEQNKDPFKAPQ